MSRRPAGLRWERISDAVGEFVRRHGTPTPRRAVLCTYGFDPERFQSVLFPLLTRRGRHFRSLVLADAGALQERLRGRFRHAFERYELAPVRCRHQGVFHPKVILLRAGVNYLVGIGSSNLTAGGFGGNLELMLFADQTHPDGNQLVEGVGSFLQRLIAHPNVLMPTTAARFVRLALGAVGSTDHVVLDSLDSPLLPQMVHAHQRACGRKANSLTVISPWHSGTRSPDGTDPSVVKALRQQFGINGQLRVCTQGKNGAGPDLGRDVQVLVSAEMSDAGSGDPVEDAHNHRPAELHAKGYVVRGSRGTTFFFGSANCTQPALMRAVAGQGNVEVLVASKLAVSGASALERDLHQLFHVADKRCDAKTPRPPIRPSGMILAGHIKPSADRVILQVEAPGAHRQPVTIAGPHRADVRLMVNKGIATVSEERELSRLFPDGLPNRETDSWCTLLWERSGASWIPFPVAVPLADPTSDRPVDALNEILDEECGRWPPASRTGADEENEGQDDNGDSIDEDDIAEIEQALTEVSHQGDLDRIAVAAALLRRRIVRRFESKVHRRAYLRQLQERIDGIPLAPHLASILRKFFSFPGGNK